MCSYFAKAQPCRLDFTHGNQTQVNTYCLLLSSFVGFHVGVKVYSLTFVIGYFHLYSREFVLITKYLTQSDKLLHANQPITAMDVHNIICHREFRFFHWFRRQMTRFFVREGWSSFCRQNGSKFAPWTR